MKMKIETMVKIVAVIKYVLDCALIIGCGILTHWITCVVLKMPAFTGNAFGLTVFFTASVWMFWTIEFVRCFNFTVDFITEEIKQENLLEKIQPQENSEI